MEKNNIAEKDSFIKRNLCKWKSVTFGLAAYDAVAVSAAFFLALWFRFDCQYTKIPYHYFSWWLKFTWIYIIFCLVTFHFTNLYRSIWKYAGYSELMRITSATGITGVFHCVFITLLFGRMPISYYIIGAMLQFMFVTGIRFSYRLIYLLSAQRSKDRIPVMLIGAGSAGKMILRDINFAKGSNEKVVCIIDDDPEKKMRLLDGVPVVGNRDDILANVEKYDIKKIVIAIPSASVSERRDILSICQETDCELKNLPGIFHMFDGKVTVSQLKDVAIEDLLGRDPIKADMSDVYKFISGKTVVVTGGGGTIGSELCRQVAAHDPKQLIIFDIYENSTYAIQLELKKKYPDLKLEVLIGSVRDSRKMFDVMRKYRPDLVLHAAAHKHVPLMEDSPCEAIKNNAIGTYNTAFAAMVNGCERFVLISTDKAVNPTNIMGASKRLCEMIIQSFDRKIKEGKAEEIPQLFTHGVNREKSDEGLLDDGSFDYKNIRTEFVAVRFGNVLGSNGSVVPIFKKQIESGGPVTVTDKDINRFFMLVNEAVLLVLLAASKAHGGEIFVLDMGEPVKIDTLARNLIKLSGYKPDVDIKIEYIGLRPGEKLYEEKLMSEEGLRKTEDDLIYIGNPIPLDTEKLLGQLDELMSVAYSNNDDDIRRYVEEMIPTYHEASEVNARFTGAKRA